MVEKQNVELKLIHMEDVVSKEVKWLWYPYIPYGKITIIEGDPGEGKTTLVLKLAAALSRGLPETACSTSSVKFSSSSRWGPHFSIV